MLADVLFCGLSIYPVRDFFILERIEFMQNLTNQNKLRKIMLCAVFVALSYVAMMTIKIPVVLFLKYEPKDVIIALASFIIGPVSGIAISFVTCLIELVTVSETGPIGFLMNFLSSACYSGLAAVFYMRKRTVKNAVFGLAVATVTTTVLMILWNYIITPWYMNVPRNVVADMLIPVFLPFNLLKYLLNSAIVMLLYKPVSKIIKGAGLVNMGVYTEKTNLNKGGSFKISIGVLLSSIVVIFTCIMLMLVLSGKF